MFQTVFTSGSSLPTQFIWTFGTLAALGITSWLLLRFGAPRLQRLQGTRRMRIIEKLPLESGRSLVLMEIDGKTVLLGISPSQMTRLRLEDAPQREPRDA